MRLYLKGHDYRYAVEQTVLVLLPDERPVFVDTPPERTEESWAEIVLHIGSRQATAAATVCLNGQTVRRTARTVIPDAPLLRERALTHTIKRAFYSAICALTGQRPAWGSLTGIRPAKLAIRALGESQTPAQVERMLKTVYDVSPERARLCVTVGQAAREVMAELPGGSFSLYVGIPFCPSRCAYCSFVSHAVEKAGHLVDDYLTALCAEIQAVAPLLRGREVFSLYIGGGTPTTLTATQLDTLLSALSAHFDLSRLREYTVEAGRPDTITAEKLTALRNHGVDRVSVNPQTMQPEVLRAIGRRHTPEDTLEAYRQVSEFQFAARNTDLIAGLPGDSVSGFVESLRQIVALAPEQITVHTLARKRGSRVTLEETPLPPPQDVEQMLGITGEILTTSGYVPYYLYRQKYMAGQFENTGWRRIDAPVCRYNLCMMEELHTVVALGAGGVTKLVDVDSGRIERLPNPKYPHEYLSRTPDAIAARLHDALAIFPKINSKES